MLKPVILLAVASLAGCTDTDTVTASWQWTESDAVGHCFASLTSLDNSASDVVRVVVFDDAGAVVAREELDCEEAGFAIDIPVGLTEIVVDISLFNGNALEQDPKSAPLYARGYRVTVADGGVDLGPIWF